MLTKGLQFFFVAGLPVPAASVTEIFRRVMPIYRTDNVSDEAGDALKSHQSSGQLDISNTSTQVVHESFRNTIAAVEGESPIQAASGTFRIGSQAPSKSVQEKLRLTSSGLVYMQKAMMIVSAALARNVSSTYIMLCLLVVLVVVAVYRMSCNHAEDAGWSQLDYELDEVHKAAQRAVQHTLMLKEKGDWRQALAKFRELRVSEGKVNKNHPFFSTVEAHMDKTETQAQLQKLFAELSEGEHLLSAEKLQLMFSNLYAEVTQVDTGVTLGRGGGHGSEFLWLISCIQESLTSSTFVSIFVLFLLAWAHSGFIKYRGDGSTQAEKGLVVTPKKISHYIELHGNVVYRSSFYYGNFQRLGTSLYFDQGINVQTFANGGESVEMRA